MNYRYYLGPWVYAPEIAAQMKTVKRVFIEPKGTVAPIDMRNNEERDETLGGCGLFAADVKLPSEYFCLGQGDPREIYPSDRTRRIFAGLLNMKWASGNTLADMVWNALTIHSDVTGDERVKPLMPNTAGQMNLFLGGLVRSKQFDLKMPEAEASIRLMQRQYERARRETLDGWYPDEFHYRRVLDYFGDKFGVESPQDIFIPKNLPIETPVQHATSYSDSFNRADERLDAGNWVSIPTSSALNVVSNEAKASGSNGLFYGRYLSAFSTDDHYSEIAVTLLDTDYYAWAAVRFNAGNSAAYFGGTRNHTGEGEEIWQLTGGTTLSRLADHGGNPQTPPFTIRLWADGTDIKLYMMDVSTTVPARTGTAVEGNTYGGFGIQGQASPPLYSTITSWSGADASSVATTIAVTGPSSGVVSVQSTNFTFTPNGNPAGTVVVTPISTLAGTWSVSPLTFTTAVAQTTKWTPSVTGAHSISSTDDGGLTNDSMTYTVSAAAATAITMSGPTTGVTGVQSTVFTIGANGSITGTVVVTPATTGTGTFSPTTVSINTGSPTGTFRYTAGVDETATISNTNDGGLSNSSTIGYTSTTAPTGGGPKIDGGLVQ